MTPTAIKERRGAAAPEGFERRDAGTTEGYYFRARTQLELRAKEGAKMPGLRGYTAVFNSWSLPLGYFEDFRESIDPAAFTKTITESDIRGLFNHSPDSVLARSRPGVSANTLRLGTDSTGLEFEIDELPDSSTGRDVAASVERLDVDGCSFGFRTIRDKWEYERPDDAPDAQQDEDEGVRIEAWRTLLEVRLFDVGPVTYPAYPETTAEVRSKVAGMRAARDNGGDAGRWARTYRHRLAELEARGGVSL